MFIELSISSRGNKRQSDHRNPHLWINKDTINGKIVTNKILVTEALIDEKYPDSEMLAANFVNSSGSPVTVCFVVNSESSLTESCIFAEYFQEDNAIHSRMGVEILLDKDEFFQVSNLMLSDVDAMDVKLELELSGAHSAQMKAHLIREVHSQELMGRPLKLSVPVDRLRLLL